MIFSYHLFLCKKTAKFVPVSSCHKIDTLCHTKIATPNNSFFEARGALEQFKYEVANEIGVPLKKGYNGDLTSAQNGYVGGYMVKKMIEAQEKMMAEKTNG